MNYNKLVRDNMPEIIKKSDSIPVTHIATEKLRFFQGFKMAKSEGTEEAVTTESYNLIAPQWAEAHKDPKFWQVELERFKFYLPSGKVLEVGSGGGRDAEALDALGYEYTGTDNSTGLLDVARKRNPTLNFFHNSVYELMFPESSFDGFWCAATLLHIPKSKIHNALHSIHNIIRSNGIGFICVKKGEGDMVFDEDDNYGPRYFSYYQDDEFTQILEESGFPILEKYEIPVSTKTTWLNFFVRVEK